MLIGAAEQGDAVAKVAALARDGKESQGVRVLAIQTLGTIPAAEAVTELEALLKADAPALRLEAIQALGRQLQSRGRSPTGPQALYTLQQLVTRTESDLVLRSAAAAALAESRRGAVWLLDEEARKELPAAIKPAVARLLRNSPYQDLRNRALIAFPPPGKLDPKKLPAIDVVALRKGDPVRGKALLAASAKNDLQCLKCHTIRGVGGAVGPDLSVIGKKASRENLIESILYPSKAIADQYVTWVIETKAGLVLTGLLIEETPEQLTLRDANAKDTTISKKEIDSRAKSPNSLMPSDLLAYMTEDDVVDVVEYLFNQKTPALTLDYWHIVGPFDNGEGDAGLDKVYPPEQTIDLKATYSGKSGSVTWRRVKPDAHGYVDLQAFLASKSDNVVSYLYREVESPADQESQLLVGTDDCAKLWMNDVLVYTNRQHRAAAPEQDVQKVQLKKGRNKLLLKINNGNGGHGFYFTILAEQELKRLESR
jgi:putative heme-binding domain-containing protein